MFPLPAWYTEAQARGKATEMALAIRVHGVEGMDAVEMPKSETVSNWWTRYLAWKESKGQRTIADSRGRFTKWIEPTIGQLEIRLVKTSDLGSDRHAAGCRGCRWAHRDEDSGEHLGRGHRCLRAGRYSEAFDTSACAR